MTEVTLKKKRPKHLALNEIRLPLPGFVSILHRISGAGLFLMLPLLLSLFGASVGSPESYAAYKDTIANPFVKLILFGLLWAFLHHFCAGIRFLLLDVHKGLDLPTARKSAGIVLVVSLALTVLIGVQLW
ncbi:MAG: succinate dehydrogenase, cytochrome b556 subunit [Zoogloea sp.]|nr:succinate dehydrogenase, cytochrome b556 subunit [Zoogloea sp.]